MADDLNALRLKVAYLEGQVSRMISLQISMYGAISKMRHLSHLNDGLSETLDNDIKEVSETLDNIIRGMPGK